MKLQSSAHLRSGGKVAPVRWLGRGLKPGKAIFRATMSWVAPVRWLGRGLKRQLAADQQIGAGVAPVRWLGRGLKQILW